MSSRAVGGAPRKSSAVDRPGQRLSAQPETVEPVAHIGPLQAALSEIAADGGPEGEAGFRALAEGAPCAIFILQDAEVRFANAAAREMTGYSGNDLDHCALWDVVHPDGREKVRRILAGMRSASASSRHEVKLVSKNGRARWMDFSACFVSYRGQPAIMGVGLDITERKVAEARIESFAYRDALTSLPNRRLLQDRVGVAMAQAHRRGERLGVLFLDLDHFKDVNDSLGHHAGDELLKAVAVRLNKAMRRDDTVARIGGDEFVVLLAHIADATQAALVARKILVLLKAPVRVGERELYVNGSIGISVYPEDGTDFDSLLKNADVALYRAKSDGRGNGQVYTLSLHAEAMARLEVEGGLRRALERGELFVEYQPARDPTVDRGNGVQGPGGAGLQGALEVCGAPGLLQMCHVGRLTGTLEATRGGRTIRMTFETGRLTGAASVEARGRDAVMEFLAWTEGRFAFHPGATGAGGPISEPMDLLILEACRIFDEKSATRIGN